MLKKTVDALRELAWPFGLTGGVYAIATRFVPADWMVSIWVTGAIVVVMLSIIISLCWHLGQRVQRPVVTIKIEQVLQSGAVFLTEPNDHLGYDMAARAYYKDGNHELLLGTGQVVIVQPDRRSQLKIDYDGGADPEIVLKLAENNDGVRGRIALRPGVIIKEKS